MVQSCRAFGSVTCPPGEKLSQCVVGPHHVYVDPPAAESSDPTGPGTKHGDPVLLSAGGAKCGCLLPLVTDHSCTDRPPSSLCMGCMPSWAIQPGLAIKLEPSASMILQEKIDSTGCVNAWWQSLLQAARRRTCIAKSCAAFSLQVENKCSGRRSEFLCISIGWCSA